MKKNVGGFDRVWRLVGGAILALIGAAALVGVVSIGVVPAAVMVVLGGVFFTTGSSRSASSTDSWESTPPTENRRSPAEGPRSPRNGRTDRPIHFSTGYTRYRRRSRQPTTASRALLPRPSDVRWRVSRGNDGSGAHARRHDDGGDLPKLLRLAWPLVLGNLLQTVYNLADMFWVGRVSSDAVAAVSLMFPLSWLFVSTAMGITAATIALVSPVRRCRRRPHRRPRRRPDDPAHARRLERPRRPRIRRPAAAALP